MYINIYLFYVYAKAECGLCVYCAAGHDDWHGAQGTPLMARVLVVLLGWTKPNPRG
jgi:hypothetical protein